MLRFLLFNRRKANVRWFMDRYTEAMALVPNASPHFVGHSNGTYLLAEGLKSYKTLRVERAALMGSVVPSNFNWPDYFNEGRIRSLRNDRASGDAVVAIFPGFFQLLGEQFPFKWVRDIGDGGFRGFDRRPAKGFVQTGYIRGGHSAALDRKNYGSLARFLSDGVTGPPAELTSERQDLLVSLAGRLCWLIWIVLAAALIAGGLLIASLAGWAGAVGYVVLVTILLATI